MMSWKAGKLKILIGWGGQGVCLDEGPVEIISVRNFGWGETTAVRARNRISLLVFY
jgi:hypothetical protein